MNPLPTSAWHPLKRRDLGFLNVLSSVLSSAEKQQPNIFHYLRNAKTIFIASDYAGEHKAAHWQTFTFLMTDLADAAAWQSERERVRRRYIRDGRRLAFKNLGDRIRRRALEPFLATANGLPGSLMTFAIDASLVSLFSKAGRLDTTGDDLKELRGLSPATAEKLLRVVHFVGLLLAGFSAPSQDVLWATDEDAIAANPVRLRGLVDILARVSSHLLSHELRHLRVATARHDKGDLSLEDLLSIADIASGGLASALDAMLATRGAPFLGFYLPASKEISGKTQTVMNWLADDKQPLRRLLVLIDEVPETRFLRATRLDLHGMPNPLLI